MKLVTSNPLATCLGLLFLNCLMGSAHGQAQSLMMSRYAPVCQEPVGTGVDAYLRNAECFGFSGVVLVEHEGTIVLHEAYGLSDRESKIPNSVRTVFDIGSIAKSVTSITMLRLQEKGLVDIDRPVSDYLDRVPEDKRQITIRHLLNHTAGLLRDVPVSIDGTRPDAVAEGILNSTLLAKPGESYRYSNAGYVLLAVLIDRIGKSGWQEACRSTFEAGGLTHTGFYQDVPSRLIARGYLECDDAGSAQEWQFSWNRTGNGHLLSTAYDVYQLFKKLDSNQLVSKPSLCQMVEHSKKEGARYGLGLQISGSPSARDFSYGHSGDYLGYHCVARRFPNLDSTVVICCNEGFAFSGLGNHRAVQGVIESTVLGKPFKPLPTVRMPRKSEIARITGRYRFADGSHLELRNSGSECFAVPDGLQASFAIQNLDPHQKVACERAYRRTGKLLRELFEGHKEKAKQLDKGVFGVPQVERVIDEILPDEEIEPKWSLLAVAPIHWSKKPLIRVYVGIHNHAEPHVFSVGWDDDTIFDVTHWEDANPHSLPIAISTSSPNILVSCNLWKKSPVEINCTQEVLRFRGQSYQAHREEEANRGNETKHSLDDAEPLTSETGIILANCSIVDIGNSTILKDCHILIKGQQIAKVAVGKELSISTNAKTIDASGLFVMPGLVDMHVHIGHPSELLSYLVHGVTTVCNMGGDHIDLFTNQRLDVLKLKERVASGKQIGPAIFSAGQALDGNPRTGPYQRALNGPAQGVEAVIEQKQKGFDLIKVYDSMNEETLKAICIAAEREKMVVAGHIPESVGIDRSIRAGVRLIAHAEEFYPAFQDINNFESVAESLAKKLKSAEVAVISNSSYVRMIVQQLEDIESVLANPKVKQLVPQVRRWWNPKYNWYLKRENPQAFLAECKRKRSWLLPLVKALNNEGVLLLSGSDAALPGALPGYAMMEEFRDLQLAGLSASDILKTATLNPAKFINLHIDPDYRIGVIRESYRSDLLLLNQNPLNEVTNISNSLEAIIVQGHYFSRTALEHKLNETLKGIQ